MRRGITWLLACWCVHVAIAARADALREDAPQAVPPRAEQSGVARDQCLLCHGSTGQGNPAIGAPRLAGMQPWYVRRQLAAFRSGTRGTHPADADGAAMRAVALAMPAAAPDGALVADVTRLQQHPLAPSLPGNIERGRELFAACAACHGVRGEGNEAVDAPALAGLNDWYIAVQLQHFRDGTRGAAEGDAAGARMRAAANTGLPDDAAIADLAAYVSRLAAGAP